MKSFVILVLALVFALAGCARNDGAESSGKAAMETPEENAVAVGVDDPELAPDALQEDEEEAVDEAHVLSEEDELHKEDPAGTYGAGITTADRVDIAAILKAPETYEGKKVVVEGKIADVCPRRGCWIDLADTASGENIRVKVNDGEIVFPLSAKGSPATVEGTVERVDLDEEQARSWMEHEAQEKGESFDPASVTGPMVIWRIKGSGAEIEG